MNLTLDLTDYFDVLKEQAFHPSFTQKDFTHMNAVIKDMDEKQRQKVIDYCVLFCKCLSEKIRDDNTRPIAELADEVDRELF